MSTSLVWLALLPTIVYSLSVFELDIVFLATPDAMLHGDNVTSAFQNTMNPIFNPTEDMHLDLQQHTVSDVIRQYKDQPYIKRQRFKQFCSHNHTATQ
eukprot:545269_1